MYKYWQKTAIITMGEINFVFICKINYTTNLDSHVYVAPKLYTQEFLYCYSWIM